MWTARRTATGPKSAAGNRQEVSRRARLRRKGLDWFFSAPRRPLREAYAVCVLLSIMIDFLFIHEREVNPSLAEVIVQDGESLESALKRFKRKVQQEDIIKEIKKHSFYLKPGEKKRAKQASARKRLRRKLRRQSA